MTIIMSKKYWLRKVNLLIIYAYTLFISYYIYDRHVYLKISFSLYNKFLKKIDIWIVGSKLTM